MLNFFRNNHYTAPALIIGLSILLVALLITSTANNFANKSDSITVTGSSDRIVKSDTAKWIISVTARVNDSKTGIVEMQNAESQIVKYLKSNKINEENIKVGNVTNSEICIIGPQGYETCSLGITGYNYNLNIIIELNEVDLVAKLSKDINSKLSILNLTSNVEYYYNNLKNIRAEMLSEATKNALERAKSVADAGGANIGKITSLSSGVFQVTAKNSVNFDDYGSYDTSEIEKKITATVKADFSVK